MYNERVIFNHLNKARTFQIVSIDAKRKRRQLDGGNLKLENEAIIGNNINNNAITNRSLSQGYGGGIYWVSCCGKRYILGDWS